MILDSVQHMESYAGSLPALLKVVDYLKRVERVGLPEEKEYIDGDNLIVIPGTGYGKKASEALLEAHNVYADVQVCFGAGETFGWKNRAACDSQIDEFDEEKDIVFYKDTPSTFVTVRQGEFVIFMPHDAHAPLIYDGEVVKLIFKVKVA